MFRVSLLRAHDNQTVSMENVVVVWLNNNQLELSDDSWIKITRKSRHFKD